MSIMDRYEQQEDIKKKEEKDKQKNRIEYARKLLDIVYPEQYAQQNESIQRYRDKILNILTNGNPSFNDLEIYIKELEELKDM